ncbi:hypothetical protein F5878DRAFT_547248, partial [Lentinula raphanica]
MPAYWDQVFVRHGLQDLKPKSTPMAPGVVLSVEQGPTTDEDRLFMKDKPYSELLGAIQF